MVLLVFLCIAVAAAALYMWLAEAVVWKVLLVFVGAFIAVHVVYFAIAALVTLFVDRSKPISKQNPLCRAYVKSATGLVMSYCGVRAHIAGEELLPESGRFVLVSNHRSGFDPLVVLNRFHKYGIGFISKPSNMALPLVGPIAYGAGCLAIDRENDRNALKTILQAASYLKNDVCSIGIYPEGTRSRSGELLPFHAGSFKIPQKANVPLVVSCVRESEHITKNIMRRKTDVYIDILEVIPAETVRTMTTHELSDHARALIEQRLTEKASQGGVV